MLTESMEVENYVTNVKEQIMNTTEHNNSDYGLYYCIVCLNNNSYYIKYIFYF